MKVFPYPRIFVCALAALGSFLAFSHRASTQNCTPPASGQLVWYPGDDNVSDIQNSYIGSLQGGAGFAPGKVGKAFSFDGANAYFQSPATALPVGSSDRTMEMWVKVNSFTAGENFFAGYGNFGTNTQSYQLGTLGTTLFFSNWGTGLFGPQLQAGVWYHIAVTNTGSAVTLYLNGAPVAAASMIINTIPNTQLTFGRIPGALGDGRKLNGLVDEPAVYNRALSLAEIQAIFNADSAGRCKPAYVCTALPANLIAWFPGDNFVADIQGRFSENSISEGLDSGFIGTYSPGKVGPAFSLNGSFGKGIVNNRSNTLYPGSDSFTVDGWIRTTQTTGTPRILSRSECSRTCAAGAASYYILNLNNGRLEGALRNSSSVSQTLTGTTLIADGRFHHVAMSRDTTAGQFRLYVDGTLEASAALIVTGTIKDDDGENDQLVIGAQCDTGFFDFSGLFAGLIDELHYFSRSLSQTEIQSIHSAGSAGFCRSCAAPPTNVSLWLPFDEASGTNATDLTNHTSAAMLRNGAAFTADGQVGGALDLSAADGEVKVLPGGPGLDYQDWEQQTISFWLNWGGTRTTAQPGLTLTKRQYIWENTADSLNTNGFAAIVIDEPGAATGEGLKAIGQPAPGSLNTGGEFQAVVPLPSTGVWEFYTCIFDKRYQRITIYKAGEVAFGRDVWTPYSGISTGAKYIGNAGPGNGSNASDFHFRGKLDEFVVANTGLSVPGIPRVDEVALNIASAGANGVCRMAGNDSFAAAQLLNGSSGKVIGFNFKATKEAGEPNHAANIGIASVWYRWQAPFSGAVNFSTVLSDFDTLLAVYTGSSVNALTLVVANDDSASGNYFNAPEFTSSVTFDAVAGTTYYIAVDGAQGRTGRINLAWGADVSISGQLSSPDQPFALLLELTGDDHRVLPFFAINGAYNFQHLRAGGNYTVRMDFSRPPNSFPCLSPSFSESPIFLPLTSSVTNLNFGVLSGSNCGTGTNTVFGLVKRSDGVGIPGISVALTSSIFNRTVLTNAAGAYTLTNIPIGINFTVAPESPNLIFMPASLACTSTDDIGGVDFIAGNTVTIGGQSRDGNTPLSGTTISLSGTRTLSLSTDANGYYSVEVPSGGNYTVTATRLSTTFSPSTRSFSNLSANQKSTDFTTVSTFTLTVASANPDSGVNITVSPTDNNGQGNGTTQFTRTYNASTVVSLTAPATAAGKNFQKWLRDGADFAGNQVSNVSVTMDANHLMSAIYVTPATMQFNASNYAVNEGGVSATITVMRAGDTSSSVSVDFATSEGSATQNQDYVVTSGTLNFAANETSKTFNVLIVDDAVVDANEIINLTLSSATGGALGSPSAATITITDNDSAGSTSPNPKRFFASLDGAQETPPNNAPATTAKGTGLVLLNGNETAAFVGLQFQNLSSAETAAHIHGAGAPGVSAPILFTLTTTPVVNPLVNVQISPTTQQVSDLKAGLHYLNVHSTNFPNGEIRGQLRWSPTLEENFFVRQQYLDFLSRDGDPGGFGFWVNQVSSCQADAQCLHDRTISTSNAFFFEPEFQQTAGYVFRAYRAAFGNSQPFPNPDGSNVIEANKLIDYSAFVADRARVVGGANLAAAQLAFANQFVSRSAFTTKYAAATTAAQFVDAMLATIQAADGVSLTAQRQTLIDQFNNAGGSNAGQAMVLYRLADDNAQNPINNQAFITAEYNRQFALTLYFGYLRRNPDIGGFLFWQSQINLAPVRDVAKQNALVCSFITAAEYQLRFGLNAPRNNAECPQ